jgi:hypothetical protein
MILVQSGGCLVILINTSSSNVASEFAFISPSPSSLPNEIFVFSCIEVWTVKEVERVLPVHAIKAYKGNGYLDPLILNFETRSPSSSSLLFSINPVIDTYHEDVEMVT